MSMRRQLKKSDIRKKLSLMKQFNQVAKGFLDVVNAQISEKENRIRVLVADMPLPKELTHNISVITIDISATKIVKKGQFVRYEKMQWERSLRNKGTII